MIERTEPMRLIIPTLCLAGILALAGCGSSQNQGDRVGGGAATGAATGATVGLVAGPIGVVSGALIGAGVGAGAAAVTTDKQINLGEPVWRNRSAADQAAR
jgi:hypothetical protein